MPRGMLLKSEGFASNLYDPAGQFTLKKFCAEKGIPYADAGLPVRLETFTAYGTAFQERLLPGLQRKTLISLDRDRDASSFRLRFDDGEVALANKVVLAVGIAEFGNMPLNWPICLPNLYRTVHVMPICSHLRAAGWR